MPFAYTHVHLSKQPEKMLLHYGLDSKCKYFAPKIPNRSFTMLEFCQCLNQLLVMWKVIVVEQKDKDSSTIHQIFSVSKFINPRTTFFALFSTSVQQQSEFHCWVTCFCIKITVSVSQMQVNIPALLGIDVRLFMCPQKRTIHSLHILIYHWMINQVLSIFKLKMKTQQK